MTACSAKSFESICDELAIYAGLESTEEELEEALCILQDFDPAGIGARDLQECLLIQIRQEEGRRDGSPRSYIGYRRTHHQRLL